MKLKIEQKQDRLMGHWLATHTTGSYLRYIYKRLGHCMTRGDTLTEKLYDI